MYEFLFALFLFSYQFKNAAFIPVGLDLTIITASILYPYSAVIAIRNRKKMALQGSCWLSLAFALYVLFSLTWGLEGFFVTRKAMVFAIFTVPALFIARYIIASDERRVRNFYYSVLVMAVLTTVEGYRVLFTNPSDIVNLLGNNYLVAGNTLGLGILFGLGLLEVEKANQKLKICCFSLQVLIAAMFVASFYLGGRGPVISLMIALLVWSWFMYKQGKSGFIKTHLPVVLYSSAFLLLIKIQPLMEKSVLATRVGEIIAADGSIDKSLGLRWDYYKSAWQAFVDHPWLGLGFGTWPQYFGIGDVEWHPHNIVLEILSELGIVGLLLLSGAIWEMLRSAEWKKNILLRPLTTASITAFVFTGLNAMKSGDINDNIFLFVVFAMLAGALKRKTVSNF